MTAITLTLYHEHEGTEYEIEAYWDLFADPSYGADRDGNRGVPMGFADFEGWALRRTAYPPVSDEDAKHILPDELWHDLDALAEGSEEQAWDQWTALKEPDPDADRL